MSRIVRGESMLPSLLNLEECSTVIVDPAQIRIGDILLYKTRGEESLTVHRLIRIDKKNRTVTLKGDNVPGLSETVDLSCVIEKAVAVMRNGKKVDLSGPAASFFGTLTALLSRFDMTPHLARRRALDTVAAALSANILYALFRKIFFYGKVSFASFGSSRGMTIHAYAGGRVMASADIRKSGDDLFVSADIKWRDRNAYFAALFLAKASEVSEKKFGSFSRMRVAHINWPGMSFCCDKPVVGGHEIVFMNGDGENSDKLKI